MTINSAIRTAGPFLGNDITTVCPFGFKVFTRADVLAVRTDTSTSASSNLVLDSDYTVTLNADQNSNPGGNVTLAAPLASGYSLVLTSQLAYLQPLDLTNQGGFYPRVITDAFDRIVIFIQQLASIANRSLRFPVADTGVNTELPQKVSRANNLLGFDGSGNPVAVAPNAQSATALQGLLAASNGTTLIGSGTRTLAEKLDEFPSVRDAPYLVMGAGADETASINAALAAAQVVYFVPNKTYVAGTVSITRAGQIIHLKGAVLNLAQLNVNADDVTIFLEGGEIRGNLHVGRLAQAAAVGQNVLVFEDASGFVVGDQVWCSYGDNGANFPLAVATAITAKNGNSVTLASNLTGTVGLPVGVYVGTFSWGSLIGSNASKRLRIIGNGKITNAPGYFYSSWRWNQADFLTNIPSIHFDRVAFNGAGLDQFLFVQTEGLFTDCSVGINYDVAKTGWVYGDGARIHIERTTVARGNFDSDFTPISDEGRSTYFVSGARITGRNNKFDGKNKLPASTYFSADCLHTYYVAAGGARHDGLVGRPSVANLGVFQFSDSEYVNYSRSLFSTTVVADANAIRITKAVFDKCGIYTQPFQLKSTVSVTIDTFEFNACAIESSGGYDAMQAQNPLFTARFNGGTLKLTGTTPYLVCAELNNVSIIDSPAVKSDGSVRFNMAVLKNTNIATAAVFGYAQPTGNLLIDNPAFAANGTTGSLSAMGIMSLQDGQGAGLRVKSVLGSHWYDVAAFGGSTYVAARLSMAWFSGAFGTLEQDDWILGVAQHVRSGFGGVYKSTYSLAATLTAAAAGGATTIPVSSVSYSGNRPLSGDRVFIRLSNNTVYVGTIAAGYVDSSLNIPLTAGLPSSAANGGGVWFVRLVAL